METNLLCLLGTQETILLREHLRLFIPGHATMIISLVVLGSQSELCFFESSSSSLASVGRELRDNMLYLKALKTTLIIIVGIFMSMSELWFFGRPPSYTSSTRIFEDHGLS